MVQTRTTDKIRECLPEMGRQETCASQNMNAMHKTAVIFYGIATAAAVSDLRTHRIPDGCSVAIAVLSLIECAAVPAGYPTLTERLFGCAVISVPMFLLALCYRRSFGGGDIKFTAACGGYLGGHAILLSAGIAVIAAALYGTLRILSTGDRNRKIEIPLGPFLLAGMIVVQM